MRGMRERPVALDIAPAQEEHGAVVSTDGPQALTRDCLDPWNYLEISARGEVRPCCNYDSIGRLDSDGDTRGLRNTDAFRALRESLLSGNLQSPCQRCHIRSTTPVATLKRRVEAAVRHLPSSDPLDPLHIANVRIDINEKCNLRCDYCAVSSPSYAGVEMEEALFERIVPLLANEPGTMVHVNGHGETTFHPKWVAWCRRIVAAGHRPSIITNLVKDYTDTELEMLTEFRNIEVSLDSDDGDMMKRIRKAVQVEKVFETIQRIREAAARRASSHVPTFSMSIGVYDPSIWTLERFVPRLVDMNISTITFWDLVEYPHQTLVRPLHRLEARERERARQVLGRVRMHLELAGIPYRFAGDFHAMVPERSPLRGIIWRVRRVLRRVRQRRSA
jgi:MoaA/NifB/PqqE/SkfB family radical SAM enzyme